MIRRIVILAAMVLLCTATLWSFVRDGILYRPASVAGPGDAKARAAEAAAQDGKRAGWSDVIHEKNLFSPERTWKEPKPVVAALAPPPPPPPPPKPDVQLKGIVLDDFGEHVAYVAVNNARATPVRKGDTIEGLAVLNVSEREVVLKWLGETIPLRMDKIKTIQNPKAPR